MREGKFPIFSRWRDRKAAIAGSVALVVISGGSLRLSRMRLSRGGGGVALKVLPAFAAYVYGEFS